MPTREYYLEQIDKELAAARAAQGEKNDGKARVGARRAAGAALAWFLSAFPRDGWGTDAIRRLQRAGVEESFPYDVRAAALRLTARITDAFAYPFATDPVDDAGVIVRHIRSLMK